MHFFAILKTVEIFKSRIRKLKKKKKKKLHLIFIAKNVCNITRTVSVVTRSVVDHECKHHGH